MDRGLRKKIVVYDDYAFSTDVNYATNKDGDKLVSFNTVTAPILVLMVGLPASGKSTLAVKLASLYNAVIHSSDNIREELSGDINNQDINNKVFDLLHKRIKDDLKSGKNVIWDSTNISSKRRVVFLKELNQQKIKCNKTCMLMATPYEQCLNNNQQRERIIPEEVITRMYKNFEIPSKYEGFDEVHIVYSDYNLTKYDYTKKIDELTKIPHDNPHHSLSIGEHCLECQVQMVELLGDKNLSSQREYALLISSLLHDVGKGFVKDFHNGKGEPTDKAHYYQHHCISAYDSLFYLRYGFSKDEFIRTILLINHHMKPFEWQHNRSSNKAIKKFKSTYGEEFYNDIMLLHECDLKAH